MTPRLTRGMGLSLDDVSAELGEREASIPAFLPYSVAKSGVYEGSIPSFRSLIRQHRAHRLLVGGSDPGAAAQVPLALGVLLGKDVAQVRLVALDPAAGALLEALGRGAPRFQLGHGNSNL